MTQDSENAQELVLRETDLKPREPTVALTEPIDMEIIEKYRNTSFLSSALFVPETCSLILNVLEKGASLDTAACYAMVSPVTLKRWLEEGMEEISKYTQEDFDAGKELSDKAKFAVQCRQRMAAATVKMGSELYDRCFESGNAHLMLWYLERLEPEKFHLKKKIDQNINQNLNAHATVEFKFTDGFAARPQEDQTYLNDRLEKLDEKYSEEKH